MAVLKIVTENIPDLMAIDLTGNALREFDSVANELKKLKNLRIMHLGENSVIIINLYQIIFYRPQNNIIKWTGMDLFTE